MLKSPFYPGDREIWWKTWRLPGKPGELAGMLTCDNGLECGPDSAGTLCSSTAVGLRPCLKNFTTILEEKILTFLRQYRDIPWRGDNYKQRRSKALVRSPSEASTMFNAQTPPYCYHWYTVFLKEQRRAPGDKVLPSNVCIKNFDFHNR